MRVYTTDACVCLVHASDDDSRACTDVRFFQSERHRKIAQYVSLSGDTWDSIGHGTHTSGSIAGKPVDGSQAGAAKYQGVAPDARLAFFDLGRANSDVVMIPYSLDASYFPYAYLAVCEWLLVLFLLATWCCCAYCSCGADCGGSQLLLLVFPL